MQLLGQPVQHRSFGNGVITGVQESMVTITFSQGEKRFQYPDAFSRFLTLTDKTRQKEINAAYTLQVNAENAEKQKQRKVREKRRRLRAMVISPCSQIAFSVTKDEFEDVFSSGTISTGCYLSGSSKGKPRIPTRVRPNSCCLLTGTDGAEKDRHILGLMMVSDEFWGNQCEDGQILCHSTYKLRLPESVSLPYWHYIEHGDTLHSWGRTTFKYYANEITQQILSDAADALSGTDQEAQALSFYQYFTDVNRLTDIRKKRNKQAESSL